MDQFGQILEKIALTVRGRALVFCLPATHRKQHEKHATCHTLASICQLEARTLFDNSAVSTLDAEIVNRGTGYELAITVDRTDMSPMAQEVPIELTDANGDAIPGLPTSFTLRIAPGSGSVTGVVQLPAGVFDPSVVHENTIGVNRVDARQETEIVEFADGPATVPAEPDFGGDDSMRDFFRNRSDKSKWPTKPGDDNGTIINNTDGWIWIHISTPDLLNGGGPRTPWYPLAPGQSTPAGVDADGFSGFLPADGSQGIYQISGGYTVTATGSGGNFGVNIHGLFGTFLPDVYSGWYPDNGDFGDHPNQYPPGRQPVFPDWWPADADGVKRRNVVN